MNWNGFIKNKNSPKLYIIKIYKINIHLKKKNNCGEYIKIKKMKIKKDTIFFYNIGVKQKEYLFYLKIFLMIH